MNDVIKRLLKQTLKPFDIGITSYEYLQHLIESCNVGESKVDEEIDLLLTIPDEHLRLALSLFKKSKSQLRQDLFVLSELGFKRNGFFVEFGATNGIDLSNTFLLENDFGWKGILAEPAKCWHNDLHNNRKCWIDTACVWSKSDSTVTFAEADLPELSTINSCGSGDHFHRARKKGKTYEVNTISLLTLLDKYGVAKDLDYLSIDTEGSEFEILSNFDFKTYNFRVITCEHNFTPAREKIYQLLTSQGYIRKFEEMSRFDDWYVKT